MFKYIMLKLGFFTEYEIEYNSLIFGDKNRTIKFYYYKNLSDYMIKEYALKWIRGKVLTTVGNVVYIERINNKIYKEQFIY